MPETPRTFNELLTLVLSFGGAEVGGGGTGVTGGGKIIKIPPRQDLVAAIDERRDEMILKAVELLAQGFQNQGMRSAIERATTEAKKTATR